MEPPLYTVFEFIDSSPIVIKDSLMTIFLLNMRFTRYRWLGNCIGKLGCYIFCGFTNNTVNIFLKWFWLPDQVEKCITSLWLEDFYCFNILSDKLMLFGIPTIKSCINIYAINKTQRMLLKLSLGLHNSSYIALYLMI